MHTKELDMDHTLNREFERTRRGFAQAIGTAGLVMLGGVWTGVWTPALAADSKKKKSKTSGAGHQESEESVTPPEDLMREHGVLDRVLLIYEAAMRKFDAKEDFDPAVITQSAQVIHDFIENYHEKSEEQHVFPRFEKANQMLDLVSVLLLQHQAGRRVTAMILQLAPDSRRDDDKRRELITSMRSFITM